MQFVSLSPAEFKIFADQHPQKSFFQTEQIAKVRQKNGWKPYYFGIKDKNDSLLAATMLVGKATFLKYKTFYAPGGPLVDYQDKKLLTFFIEELKKELKKEKGYLLHIDPYYELIERDRDGQIVKGGFNHQSALKNLHALGFKSLKISEQPKYLFALDINNHTPDELLMSFKNNTRNLIRRTKKDGVVVRELKKSELSRLKKITEKTSERRDFQDKPLFYYRQMYDLFAPENQVKFLIAETQKDGKTIDLSAAMFMLYGDEIIYLFSGSDEKYMHEYNAQYAIQWHMIKYAAEHGFKRYNFYGIQGLPDPSKKGYGIYRFKKGFGGRVIELIGSQELPLDLPIYYFHSALSKIKNLFH